MELENDVGIGITQSKNTLARDKPLTKRVSKRHTKLIENLEEEAKSEESSSDYEPSNASDVEEEFEADEHHQIHDLTLHNWQEQFPMLEQWTPEADKLAKKRKTMASQSNLTRPPTIGRKQKVQVKETTKVAAYERVLQFPGQSFYAHAYRTSPWLH